MKGLMAMFVPVLLVFFLAEHVASGEAKSQWQPEWERTVEVAKAEGTVVIAGPSPPQYREGIMAFQKTFPGIKIEFIGAGGRDFSPRILAERRAAKFLWDVHIGGAGTPNQQLKPEGVFDPLMPALILPEVLKDDLWSGGFADGWMDKEKRFIYAFSGRVTPQVYVNRDLISERELARVEDLLSPQWREKISWNEPRAQGSGSAVAGYWFYVFGEKFLRSLFQHGVVAVRDLRQQAEWVVRGKYPIAVGLDDRYLDIFKEKGVGLNVKPLAFDTPAGGGRMGPGFGNVMLVNRSPHPNAANVFLNWLLSREGQVAYVKASEINSRRLDVREGPAETAPNPGVKYFNINKEEMSHYQDKAVAIAKEILR